MTSQKDFDCDVKGSVISNYPTIQNAIPHRLLWEKSYLSWPVIKGLSHPQISKHQFFSSLAFQTKILKNIEVVIKYLPRETLYMFTLINSHFIITKIFMKREVTRVMPVDLEQNHALIQTNKSMLHYVCIT